MKIIQLLLTPNDNTWQGSLLCLADDGGTYRCGSSGSWEPFIAPPANGWQPIGGGLPEYMTAALIYCPKDENIFCAYYHFYEGSTDTNRVPIWCFFDNDGRILEVKEEVTHWMPLPQPPTA